jgi:hypothetical protein
MTKDDHSSGISDHDATEPALPPAGTLVIRTWHEREEAPGLRARITYSLGPGDEPSIVASADPEQVLSIVRQWLFDQTVPPGVA